MLALPAHAMPSVSGLSIFWPDDGYYQVQRSTVINHSTQQRFEGILVSDSTVGGEDLDVQVIGNRLVFPEDNWFQVHNASTFESLCNEESECEVDSGSYNIINHTLQQRFENVQVGSPDAPENPVSPDTPPMVNGNVISWADDCWYQVQDSFEFTTICEGGSECEVAPGNYRIINLSINTRYESIVVGGDEPVEPLNLRQFQRALTLQVLLLRMPICRCLMSLQKRLCRCSQLSCASINRRFNP